MKKIFKPKYVKKILVNEAQVIKSIDKAAAWLNKKFKNEKDIPLFVGVLRGSVPFYGHLIMKLNFDITLDFLSISSFKGALKRTTEPKVLTFLSTPIKNKHVIIVEDVIDSAKTMSLLLKVLKKQHPKSITMVCLVDKPDGREIKFEVDYACNTIYGTPFLVGYGLDVKEKARNLPYIAEFDKRYFNKL